MDIQRSSLVVSRPLVPMLAACAVWFATSLERADAYPFADTFEAGSANWTTTGGWGLSTTRFASPSHAMTDSPGTFYANNSDARLTRSTALDLAGSTRPAVSFQQAFSLEEGYDFGTVELSTNGGAAWFPAAEFSGEQNKMMREQVDLSAYAGWSDVRLRFRLVTDASVVLDGWYIDDVSAGEAPAVVALATPTEVTPNRVRLSWPASEAADFTLYRLYRAADPDVDWHTARLIAEISDRGTTSFTDIMVCPKTKYYYRLMVLNAAALHSLSAAVSATTPPGMDYPFLDNGEGGPGTWIATAPWALSEEQPISAGRAWSDSPGTNYANGIASQPLTLVAPLNLGAAVAPVLSFVHNYSFASGRQGPFPRDRKLPIPADPVGIVFEPSS